MGKPKLSIDTDPELLRQMDEAAASEEPVQAVMRLRPDKSSEIIPSPQRTEELAHEVLERVKKRVGGETRCNVFRHLGSFAIAAQPQFLRELLEQPEIAAARANLQPKSIAVDPDDEPYQPEQQSEPAASTPYAAKTQSRRSGRKPAHGKNAK